MKATIPSASTGFMTIASLESSETAQLSNLLPESRPALARLVKYLADNPHSPSVNVNHSCAIGNISQEATAANKKLFGRGYMVGCMRPPVPLKNRFEQETSQHLWSLYALPKEAAIFDLEKKDGTYVYSDEFKSAAKNMNELLTKYVPDFSNELSELIVSKIFSGEIKHLMGTTEEKSA